MKTEISTKTDEAAASDTQTDLTEIRAEFRERIAMSSSEWAKVSDNPIQRSTELHARRAKHLHVPGPTHRFVSMAVLPSGQRYKLDGHTRSYLWEQGELSRPHALAVDVFECADVATVELLYRHFDNPTAAESPAEQLTGATNRFELEFQSVMLRDGRYGAGLKRAFVYVKGISNKGRRELPFVYAAVDMFQEELFYLDSLRPTRDRFPSGIISAYLVTIRRAGEAGLDFWSRYAQDLGTKTAGVMDGVQALSEEVMGVRQSMIPLKLPMQEHLYQRGVTAFEGFREGRTYQKGLKTMNRANIRDYARGPKGDLVSRRGESKRTSS